MPGIELEKLTWQEAEKVLGPDTIIVIPLGASLKEHGLHLPLNNDFLTARYLADALLVRSDIVLAAMVNYSYYPAFIEYPGSVSLSPETSAAVIVEICTSLARFGPEKFYVLNTGISTAGPLASAAEKLSTLGIKLAYTDFDAAFDGVAYLSEQEGGSHADEMETSMMMIIAPHIVNMQLACKDYHTDAVGRLTRDKSAGLSYSKSGVWGDATLASKDKGSKIVECLIEYLIADIEQLRSGAD